MKLGRSYHIVIHDETNACDRIRLVQERRLMSALAIEQPYIHYPKEEGGPIGDHLAF